MKHITTTLLLFGLITAPPAVAGERSNPADVLASVLDDAKMSKAERRKASKALAELRETQAELQRMRDLQPRHHARLSRPDHLTPQQKRALTERMAEHAAGMNSLWWAVVFMDNDSVKETAMALKEGPFGPETDDFATLLPQRFYTLKDELREESKALIETAEDSPDPEAVVRAYNRLLYTCVKCHAANARDWGPATDINP